MPIALENDRLSLRFSSEHHGALTSIVDRRSGVELLRDSEAPRLLWKLGLRRGVSEEPEWLTSSQAAGFEAAQARDEGVATVVLRYRGLPGPVEEVIVRVGLEDGSALSRWRVEVRGVGEEVAVCMVTCPMICGPVRLGDPAAGETLVAPVQGEGYLFRDPFPVRDGLPLCSGPGPETADVGVGRVGGRYPGAIALQMLALYGERAGLYFAAHDGGQHPKELLMGPMPDLGLAPVMSLTHLCSEVPGEDMALPYDAVVGVFNGDWYAAADIYKAWAREQWWCERTLWDRDIASWLRTGVGGVFQMSNYHIPQLRLNHPLGQIADTVNEISAAAGVPLLCLLFNWENGGAWTGPKGFFPPREGQQAFVDAMARLRAAGNLGFVYMTGNNWYVKIDYEPPWDSRPQFIEEGEALVLRRPDGEYRVSTWYEGWQGAQLCPRPQAAVELHAGILERCLELGCTVVQIDNFPCGGSAACYGETHGHPRGHGPWWSEACGQMLQEMRRRAKTANPECALTTEGISENFIPWLDLYDQRAGNMEYFGHYSRGMPMGGETIPLFGYIYNEYIGAYYAAMPECNRPEVLYWTRGLGKAICQGVLPAAGRYFPDPPHHNPVTLAFYEKIVRCTGRELYPYLMFGQMLRPPDIEVPWITAQYLKFLLDSHEHRMDPGQRHEVQDRAVQHAAYRGRDGSIALLFVNVSEDPVSFDLEVPAYGAEGPVSIERVVDSVSREVLSPVELPHQLVLDLEPLSIALLIVRAAQAVDAARR